MTIILSKTPSIDKLRLESDNEPMQENPQLTLQEDSVGRKIWLFFIDTAQTVLFAGLIFFVIYVFLFRPFQVSGESMFSSFKDREYILTNIISLKFADPARGDVIVFKAPTDPDKDFIKRVVAIPGDSVYIREGYVYVNGKKVDEHKYLNQGIKTYGGTFLKDNVKITIPPGNYLVMGDNRVNSSDSREWGLLNKDAVIGKAFLVYWPLNHSRMVDNPFTK